MRSKGNVPSLLVITVDNYSVRPRNELPQHKDRRILNAHCWFIQGNQKRTNSAWFCNSKHFGHRNEVSTTGHLTKKAYLAGGFGVWQSLDCDAGSGCVLSW